MITVLSGLIALVGSAAYVELLGWRIIAPGISLSQAWSQDFVSGALRTAAAATLLGFVPVLLGLMLPRTRSWIRSQSLLLWISSAAIFIVAMAALVAWAP